MFKYFPHTPEDIREMLDKIGLEKLDDLFRLVPSHLLKEEDLALPSSHSEQELINRLLAMSAKNQPFISFVGAGSYECLPFSVIGALTSRQEFLTSYTPYQPEISQGTLQYIFEFQSMICELTGMDVANASMYDGATATAEALFMATSQTKRNKVLISKTVHPNTIAVVKTYAKFRNVEVVEVEADSYLTSEKDFLEKCQEDVACFIGQYPNFYGYLEDYGLIKDTLVNQKSLFIMNADPSCLPVLKSPKSWGADIVCGEAQSLGIPLSFGGPYLGYLACTTPLLRKMPGRICGMTKDVDGKRAFVLTLQAREQHIRREKANSNICSNQSLMALSTVIYMSLLGKQGLKEVAMRAYNHAHYLKDQLTQYPYFSSNPNEFFKEFVIQYHGNGKELHQYLQEKGFLAGMLLADNQFLLCATEARSKAEIDAFVRTVGEYHVR